LLVEDEDWNHWCVYPVFSSYDTHLAYIYYDQSGNEYDGMICQIRIMDLENPEADPVHLPDGKRLEYDYQLAALYSRREQAFVHHQQFRYNRSRISEQGENPPAQLADSGSD